MRQSAKRLWIVGVLMMFALPLAVDHIARAALEEKPVLDDINDTVAVLRYLYRNMGVTERDLRLVRASRSLTQTQYEAQKQLYDSEVAKGNEERAKIFANNLSRLKRHLDKLGEFDFEGMYAKRVADLQKQIDKLKVELDARMTEFETLFGKKPAVELDFEEEREAMLGKREEEAYFLKLD